MEDPELVWYVAANHMQTDSFEKRGKKGVLITISDEPVHRHVSRKMIKHYIGDTPEKDLVISEILKKASEAWDIYHIHIEHGSYRLGETNWEQLLDSNVIATEANWEDEIKRIIPNLVIGSYNSFNDLVEAG